MDSFEFTVPMSNCVKIKWFNILFRSVLYTTMHAVVAEKYLETKILKLIKHLQQTTT